jgi:hypothetical protein
VRSLQRQFTTLRPLRSQPKPKRSYPRKIAAAKHTLPAAELPVLSAERPIPASICPPKPEYGRSVQVRRRLLATLLHLLPLLLMIAYSPALPGRLQLTAGGRSQTASLPMTPHALVVLGGAEGSNVEDDPPTAAHLVELASGAPPIALDSPRHGVDASDGVASLTLLS